MSNGFDVSPDSEVVSPLIGEVATQEPEGLTDRLRKIPYVTEVTYGLGAQALRWWKRVDSDHRSETQQIYSLPPLATRERFLLSVSVAGNTPALRQFIIYQMRISAH